MHVFSKLLACAAVAALAAVACSSSSDGGTTQACNTNPWQCAIGQTCWPADATLSFKCLTSGAGKVGDECQFLVGTPTCGDGLTCMMAVGASGGVCTPYCDRSNPARACPNNEACVPAQIQTSAGSGPIINICNPPAPHVDGGVDAGADAGADASADTAADSQTADSPTDATGQ